MTDRPGGGEELLEQVARAIYAEAQAEARDVAPQQTEWPSYEDDEEDSRNFCRRLTRAALSASGAERMLEALEQIRDLNGQNYDSDRAWALAMQLRAKVALEGWLATRALTKATDTGSGA